MRAIWKMISASFENICNCSVFPLIMGKFHKKNKVHKKKNPHLFHIFNIWKLLFCHRSTSGEEVLKNPLQLFVPFSFETQNLRAQFYSCYLITDVSSTFKFHTGYVLHVNMIMKYDYMIIILNEKMFGFLLLRYFVF